MSEPVPEFRCYENHGFQLAFANGWTISVAFGPGNYCEHRNNTGFRTLGEGPAPSEHKSKNAEVSIWDAGGDALNRLHAKGTWGGWMLPDKVGRLIGFVQALPITAKACDLYGGRLRSDLLTLLTE